MKDFVESFPMTIEKCTQKYRLLPPDASSILYHYTSRSGLKGILKYGGLRATYRKKMNDKAEFEYAKNVIHTAISQYLKRNDISTASRSIAEYTLINLQKKDDDSDAKSSSYCACLTFSSDDMDQWNTYAESGNGFAIGFDWLKILNGRRNNVLIKQPFYYCSPVIYDEPEQNDLVINMLESGINDLKNFGETCSTNPSYLTAFRNRIIEEIVTQLYVISDFIKSPEYSSEREMRVFIDFNDGTLEAKNIRFFEKNGKSIPYLMFDFRNPQTKILPICEIKVGPKATFEIEKKFVEERLADIKPNWGDSVYPRITQSQFAIT
ncbi:MAG: DUF2971 domain-containing protein [Candidatus Hinthialibacter antarcticus]|nr:DUF2971 domain-containing protein [Candidatus Hinthialibacter antarcticus]